MLACPSSITAPSKAESMRSKPKDAYKRRATVIRSKIEMKFFMKAEKPKVNEWGD
jgi:hypothetical protein